MTSVDFGIGRGLELTLELQELGIPMVVCLNMMDEAQHRGMTISSQKLSELLGLPVVETVASRGTVTPARVLRARRDGLRWQLDLTLPEWSLELSWEGYARELQSPPIEGMGLRIHVPARAWLPLEEA